MKIVFFALIFFLTSTAQAYKFICNSIDANGNVESDECGVVCDDATAPRWVPADIEILIDLAVLPPGVDTGTWQALALSSLDPWNNVSGAKIRIRYGGVTVKRSFGSESKYHEIFWVNDANEWRTKVGSGDMGTLAVTLSPYTCPTSLRSYREIYDGDIMLNGSEDFSWKASCQGRGCQSIRSTLTHELGHMAGLGHPCTLCSTSIMTAKAGSNIEYPMFDDQQGLRALYPGTSSGTLGSICDQNDACQSGYKCITQEGAHYCSRPCSSGNTCPAGYACEQNMCQFAIGRLSGAVGIGESCKTKYCDDNLVCAGSGDKDHLYCYAGCSKSGGCENGKTCVSLEGEKDQGVCIQVGKLGESCHWKDPCEDQLICVIEKDNGICMTPCVSGQNNTCAQGEPCRDLGQGKSACWIEAPTPTPPTPTPPTIVTDMNETGSLCTSMPTPDRTSVAHLSSLLLLAAITLSLRRLPDKWQ